MKKISLTVILATLFVFLLETAPYAGVPAIFVLGALFLAPFVILYMAYVILRNGQPSSHKFEERFYDDWDYERNVPR